MKNLKKEVKCKLVKFSPSDWLEVERRAASLNMKTGTYIQRMAVDGEVLKLEAEENRNVLLELNRIGVSLNQLARKANETNNIYADDIKRLKSEVDDLCLTLNQYVYTLHLTKV